VDGDYDGGGGEWVGGCMDGWIDGGMEWMAGGLAMQIP